jgi:hypothetical protein
MVRAGLTSFQVISLVMSTIIIIVLLRWIKTDHNHRYMWILILTWMLHSHLFYSVLLLEKANIGFDAPIRFTDWSSILRNHSITTVFTMVIGRILYRKTLKN